jgi:hypothetical protein
MATESIANYSFAIYGSAKYADLSEISEISKYGGSLYARALYFGSIAPALPGVAYTTRLPLLSLDARGKFNNKIFQKTRGRLVVYDYVPAANPRTAKQQAWRQVLASLMVEWRALSDSDKTLWHQKGQNLKRILPAFHTFMKYRLKEEYERFKEKWR